MTQIEASRGIICGFAVGTFTSRATVGVFESAAGCRWLRMTGRLRDLL